MWNIAPGHLACCSGETSWEVLSDAIVIATGAYDRPVPLPGWTLPGVFTSGGVQTLLKSQRMLAGRRVLLTGTGPLNLVLANQLAEAGAKVVAVLELANPSSVRIVAHAAWAMVAALGRHRLCDAVEAAQDSPDARLDPDRGARLRSGHLGRDRQGRPRLAPDQGHASETLEIDTICLGYGLVPSTELSRLIGCEHRYDVRLGGWVPEA